MYRTLFYVALFIITNNFIHGGENTIEPFSGKYFQTLLEESEHNNIPLLVGYVQVKKSPHRTESFLCSMHHLQKNFEYLDYDCAPRRNKKTYNKYKKKINSANFLDYLHSKNAHKSCAARMYLWKMFIDNINEIKLFLCKQDAISLYIGTISKPVSYKQHQMFKDILPLHSLVLATDPQVSKRYKKTQEKSIRDLKRLYITKPEMRDIILLTLTYLSQSNLSTKEVALETFWYSLYEKIIQHHIISNTEEFSTIVTTQLKTLVTKYESQENKHWDILALQLNQVIASIRKVTQLNQTASPKRPAPLESGTDKKIKLEE